MPACVEEEKISTWYRTVVEQRRSEKEVWALLALDFLRGGEEAKVTCLGAATPTRASLHPHFRSSSVKQCCAFVRGNGRR